MFKLVFMQRIRIGVLGSGPSVEWAILPTLLGPDAVAPPDIGAWWSRRPAPTGDIRYQAPADPQIVALCDAGEARKIGAKVSPRLDALGRQSRAATLYCDVLQMLREAALDVLFVGENSGWDAADLVALVARTPGVAQGVAAPAWLWIEGPPARSIPELNAFARAAREGKPALWMALPLRRAAAHRAARRLIERDAIGNVTALQARFPFSLDEARFGEAYAAFDVMLSFFAASQAPRAVWATRHSEGVAQLLLSLAGGATISALFCAGDTWNAPLPRLEICGTQGRFLVCEAGRRLSHYVPREGARLWEPPGLAAHVSGANLSGYGEDIKAFLSVCADNPAPFNAERALDDAARALGVWEAVLQSLETGAPVAIEARGVVLDDQAPAPLLNVPSHNLTLDLV